MYSDYRLVEVLKVYLLRIPVPDGAGTQGSLESLLNKNYEDFDGDAGRGDTRRIATLSSQG